ncbi:hypothetical protein GCM10011385_16400 [Nitratireductor aestuarii]|uniref:Uncharacterized protein n=1 Tax=Nitratireductor aestuarii TaxID=1735103 RepID=A0A916W3G3_9HYPH|nr:hypothetical protein GCM10011385_16400 [Nitratireductor aestuarii]
MDAGDSGTGIPGKSFPETVQTWSHFPAEELAFELFPEEIAMSEVAVRHNAIYKPGEQLDPVTTG